MFVMRCPHCNGEHPDSYRFCPETGEEIVLQFKACTNEDCSDYGKYILPLEARFCPKCGEAISDVDEDVEEDNVSGVSFHIRYSQYDLVPYNDFKFRNKMPLFYTLKTPEYIEDVYHLNEGYNYLYIARKGKLGALRFEYRRHWYGDEHLPRVIIPCEYEKIDDEGSYYKCFKDGKIVMFDRTGKEIK